MVPSQKRQKSPPFFTNGAFSTLSLFEVVIYCNQAKLVVFVHPLNPHTVHQCERQIFSFPYLLPQLQPYSTFIATQRGLPPSMSCTQCTEPGNRDALRVMLSCRQCCTSPWVHMCPLASGRNTLPSPCSPAVICWQGHSSPNLSNPGNLSLP